MGSGRVGALSHFFAASKDMAGSNAFILYIAASAELDATVVGQMNAWRKDKQGPALSPTATQRVLTLMLPMVS